MATLYDELGVPPWASDGELHRAYRARARRLHPDVVGDDPTAGEAMRRLNEAWTVLRDPAARAAYDSSLADPGADALADRDATLDAVDHVPARPRWSPVLVLVAILVAIFVFTAYAAAPVAR